MSQNTRYAQLSWETTNFVGAEQRGPIVRVIEEGSYKPRKIFANHALIVKHEGQIFIQVSPMNELFKQSCITATHKLGKMWMAELTEETITQWFDEIGQYGQREGWQSEYTQKRAEMVAMTLLELL